MDLWKLISDVSHRYGQKLEQHKRRQQKKKRLSEITAQQIQYLLALKNCSVPTISFLKDHFQVRSPTATVIVNRLVGKGFIKRKLDSSDKRSSHLVLTSKARGVLEIQKFAFKSLADDIRGALSKAELREYERLTEKVCRNFEKMQSK